MSNQTYLMKTLRLYSSYVKLQVLLFINLYKNMKKDVQRQVIKKSTKVGLLSIPVALVVAIFGIINEEAFGPAMVSVLVGFAYGWMFGKSQIEIQQLTKKQ